MRTLLAALAALSLLALPAVAQTPAPAEPFITSDALVPAGDFALSTRLYAPVGRERYPIIVLVSGSGTERTADDIYTQILARAFAARGIGALAYDKRGTGQSTGTFTGSDFDALGEDAAALIRYAQTLPQAESVGVWGISQAGWVIPAALRHAHDVSFAILVSPAGVNPHEQVAYFLYRQALSWGLTPEEATETERMHQAVALHYSGRASYRHAQAIVDSYRERRWFHNVVTHPYWDEMTPEGRILTPEQLRNALRERPSAFEIYASRSSFVDYAHAYRVLRRLPTLIIYGGGDELVPVDRSRAIMERSLRSERRRAHEFRVFDGASHDIQTPDGHVRADYLDAIASWARRQFDAAS